ncbi:hypothetical protein D3C79_976630 [compost metagenome]
MSNQLDSIKAFHWIDNMFGLLECRKKRLTLPSLYAQMHMFNNHGLLIHRTVII